jgi:hypothetical protein
MKGHNHAWQLRSVATDGAGFTASLWKGSEKKLDDEEPSFTLDPKCKHWLGGKPVERFPFKADDRVYLTWVLRKDRRVAVLVSDAASLDAIRKEKEAEVVRQVAAEGVGGQVEAVEGGSVRLLVFSTYWAQMRDFKAGQVVRLAASGKGGRPTGDLVEAKLVSLKTGGPYGSGPTDVVLELQRPADARALEAWLDGRVVRLLTK